jgi:hypothetical protein
VDSNLVAQLLIAAVRLTGLPTLSDADLPPVLAMSKEAITQEMCPLRPAGCDTLVALFEPGKYRVIYRNTLDFSKPFDRSFVLHELVHVLQFKAKGASIFASCKAYVGAEREAYLTQDRFLAENGVEIRVKGALRFMHCPEEPVKGEAAKN